MKLRALERLGIPTVILLKSSDPVLTMALWGGSTVWHRRVNHSLMLLAAADSSLPHGPFEAFPFPHV